MIDFVKLDISYLGVDTLIKNPLLEFVGSWEQSTGVIKEFPLNAKYFNLVFVIKSPKFIQLQGSLHKYWNAIQTNILQNSNDYTYSDLLRTLSDLESKFGIDPSKTIINNIEFGVNLIVPDNPDLILNRIINHKGYRFSQHWERNKHIKECVKQRYIVKAYNKGLQYNLKENVFRFELKVTRMMHCPFLSSLLDLTYDNLLELGRMLVKTWNEILLLEISNIPQSLSDGDKALLDSGKNAEYWAQLRSEMPETYYKRLKKFRTLNETLAERNNQSIIGDMIDRKVSALLGEQVTKFQELTNFPMLTSSIIGDSEIPAFNTSSILLNSEKELTIPRRFCKTCNRDITNQKPGSLYCSEKLFGKEVKRCRNLATNPRNNLRRRISKGETGDLLFDIQKYLALTPYQLSLLGLFQDR